MAALADFARYVRPEVPMCPEIQIMDAVLHAGIDFCKRTKILRETVQVTTEINKARYDLTAYMATGTEPAEILDISRSEYDHLNPSSENEFLSNALDQPGTPEHFYLDGRELVLWYAPNSVESLDVLARAYPAETATALPDALYQRYRMEIAAGAKTILMSMANQPWSNLQQAAIYLAMFNSAIDSENLRYAKGGGTNPLRVTAQFM